MFGVKLGYIRILGEINGFCSIDHMDIKRACKRSRKLGFSDYCPDNYCAPCNVAFKRCSTALYEGNADTSAENENDTGQIQIRPADNAAKNG